jgi:hypothetical protein
MILYESIAGCLVKRRPLILTSDQSPKDWYDPFPQPVVACAAPTVLALVFGKVPRDR